MRIAIVTVALLASALTLAACNNSVNDLKPGVSRNRVESGFIKTTEGLELEVRGRSYDDVWAAVQSAVNWAGTEPGGLWHGPLTVVDWSKARGIVRTDERRPGGNPPGLGLVWSYVGVFIKPATPGADVYTVEVSKIMKVRTAIIEGRNWEADLLRAIEANLRTTQ